MAFFPDLLLTGMDSSWSSRRWILNLNQPSWFLFSWLFCHETISSRSLKCPKSVLLKSRAVVLPFPLVFPSRSWTPPSCGQCNQGCHGLILLNMPFLVWGPAEHIFSVTHRWFLTSRNLLSCLHYDVLSLIWNDWSPPLGPGLLNVKLLPTVCRRPYTLILQVVYSSVISPELVCFLIPSNKFCIAYVFSQSFMYSWSYSHIKGSLSISKSLYMSTTALWSCKPSHHVYNSTQIIELTNGY